MARRPSINSASTPIQLSPQARAWAKKTATDHNIFEGHRQTLLYLAAQLLDTMENAHNQIVRDGLTVASPQGIKAHPAIAIERDARAAFARLIKQLKLDKEEKRPVGRPPLGLGVTYDQLAAWNGNDEA